MLLGLHVYLDKAGRTHVRTSSTGSEMSRLSLWSSMLSTQQASALRPRSMKTISVVLPCASEGLLMVKTVRSFYENTPTTVLKEIIVVDDGSRPPIEDLWPADDADPSGVKGIPIEGFDPLPKPGHWRRIKEKTQFIRHEKTMGLMASRSDGANAARGDIVALMDCHVKPDKYWYVPIISEISENYKRVAVPSITVLNPDTWLETRSQGMSQCYFTWDSEFKWYTDRNQADGDNFLVPMMSGGLLAMSRRWWHESGGYDPEMIGFGGENIEQSLRIWLCGGEIVSVKDSYIAHMWRSSDRKSTQRHYKVPQGSVIENKWRAASSWLDNFAAKTLTFPKFARFRQHPALNLTYSERIKKRLNCNSFDWYIDKFSNIFIDAGIMPQTVFQIQSRKSPAMCLERTGSVLGHSAIANGPLLMAPCNAKSRLQLFHFANQNKFGKCCSGLRGYDSDQCLTHGGTLGSKKESIHTTICTINGGNRQQIAKFGSDGRISLDDEETWCLHLKNTKKSNVIEWKLAVDFCRDNQVTAWKWNRLHEHKSLEYSIYERVKKESYM